MADFYTRFAQYPLVVDKWFSLQAIANRAQIFDDLAWLRAHPDFNIKNPNRVRSLYSAFAINNPVKFHDASGKGYAFLRDAIIELNAINPQIAARMVTPLREWKRYTPALQAQMKAALEAILGNTQFVRRCVRSGQQEPERLTTGQCRAGGGWCLPFCLCARGEFSGALIYFTFPIYCLD